MTNIQQKQRAAHLPSYTHTLYTTHTHTHTHTHHNTQL